MLLQELRILELLGNNVSEVHLTDFAYENFSNDVNNCYNRAFVQFMQLIKEKCLETRVYVHTDPNKLKTSNKFNRRFDVICGIDIDWAHGCTNHRPIMKEIAANTLKIDGMMCISQNFEDQVDLCHYEISDNGDIVLVRTEDYVKPPYYGKYIFEHTFTKAYYYLSILVLLLISLVINNLTIPSILASLYCLFCIVTHFFECEHTSYDRKIKNLVIIIKQ